ncbi:Leucine-rich repeat extensin-like protein 6 [Abeliophyllum distichum]|uniref:Leucine-rich repeat extensin-like protein 6 n=1 Tax=Abeliophyllum distichum TaxID=126358 RepID=A0ABD1Q520_9LAMI
MGNMKSLEQLNVAHNKLSGQISDSICSLPRLENFTYSDNYFCAEANSCLKLKDKDDGNNCIPYRPKQRSAEECRAFYSHPVDCSAFGCLPPSPPPSCPPPPPPRSSPPPPYYYHYP